MPRSDYPTESAWRTRPERIEAIMSERGVDRARALQIARGHGTTPEHGKIRAREVGFHTIYETRSNQAAERVLNRAARDSAARMSEGKKAYRVAFTVHTTDGHSYTIYDHPKGKSKPGLTATYLAELRAEDGGSIKGFLSRQKFISESEHYEVSDEGAEYRVLDFETIDDETTIDTMDITVYDFE